MIPNNHLTKKSPPCGRRQLSRLNFSCNIHFRQPPMKRYNWLMQARIILPENYHQLKTLDLSNSHSVLWMNLAAIPLLFLFGWFFVRMMFVFRPFNPFQNNLLKLFTHISISELIAYILSIIFIIIVHELIHGILFWIFTHEQPQFSLRSGYAFAAAPTCYLPSGRYILVGLSPLVMISVVSILLAWITVFPMVPYLLVIATFNAAGSIGDLIVVGWVLKQPSSALIKDEGDRFSSFGLI
jgi:hypothetical protein